MIAHAEPVTGWGLEPCGKRSFPITARVSARGGAAPRPTGSGRGNSEVQTSLNRTPRTNGRRLPAGGFETGDQHERRPSPATAPSLCSVLDHCLQDGDRDRAVGKPRYDLVVATQVVGDLGKSRS